MKRKELMKRLAEHARRQGLAVRITEGANHTKVHVGDRLTVVPRHAQINDITAKAILKQIGVVP